MLKNGTKISTMFDEYTIIKQCGQGGNGVVFYAHNSDKKEVAIKVLDSINTSSEKRKRFKNELNFCSQSNHPNIVKVIDWGIHKTVDGNDLHFYVMPYYDQTLRNKIKSDLTNNEAIQFFSNILNAIEYSHKLGVWHRDIKPENILIDSEKSIAIVSDFGIAHFQPELKLTNIETKKNEILANRKYSAPEQNDDNGIVDGRSDIYALGLILNELFTRKIISGTGYEKIGDSNRDYAFLDQLVDSMIQQDPQKRIFPAKEVIDKFNYLNEIEQKKKELQGQASTYPLERKGEFTFNRPKIEDIKINSEENKLYIHLNSSVPLRWKKILKEKEYSFENIVSFGPEKFSDFDDSQDSHSIFTINLYDANKSDIQNIIKFFNQWIDTVTTIYISEEKGRILLEKKEREGKIRLEIEKLEIENQMRELVKKM